MNLFCFKFSGVFSVNVMYLVLFDFPDYLVSSLRRLVLGSEQYGSRLCLTIDVCSERQTQLILEVSEISLTR